MARFFSKKRVLATIAEIKKNHYAKPIDNSFDSVAYTLIPITYDQQNDKLLIRILGAWRKKHEQWFPVQFRVTEKGTKIWVKERLLDEPDRLLFMIQVRNEYIGHIGLYRFNFKKRICEIDNIIRGKKMYPGIMEHAIITMMEWGRKMFGICQYRLQTTSDNGKALALYTRLGFVETKRVPLVRIEKNDKMEWREISKGHTGIINRYAVFMEELHEKA